VHDVLSLVRLIAPAKWLIVPTVIVDDATVLICADAIAGSGFNVKSPASTVTFRERDREPLVPVTVAV